MRVFSNLFYTLSRNALINSNPSPSITAVQFWCAAAAASWMFQCDQYERDSIHNANIRPSCIASMDHRVFFSCSLLFPRLLRLRRPCARIPCPPIAEGDHNNSSTRTDWRLFALSSLRTKTCILHTHSHYGAFVPWIALHDIDHWHNGTRRRSFARNGAQSEARQYSAYVRTKVIASAESHPLYSKTFPKTYLQNELEWMRSEMAQKRHQIPE